MTSRSISIACQKLASKRLFYPSSGGDFMLPIETFFPFINDFWFVDPSYQIGNPLLDCEQFEHLGESRATFSGTTIRNQIEFSIRVRQDTYIHPSQKDSSL